MKKDLVGGGLEVVEEGAPPSAVKQLCVGFLSCPQRW